MYFAGTTFFVRTNNEFKMTGLLSDANLGKYDGEWAVFPTIFDLFSSEVRCHDGRISVTFDDLGSNEGTPLFHGIPQFGTLNGTQKRCFVYHSQ